MYFTFAKQWEDYLFFVFRVFVGLLFFMHGSQKIFGWFGAKGIVALGSLMGVVGVGETLVGLGILLGFFTRLAALGGLVIMVGAWVRVHLSQGINPLGNGGETALLYFLAFLVLLAYGARKWSLEHHLLKKELF